MQFYLTVTFLSAMKRTPRNLCHILLHPLFCVGGHAVAKLVEALCYKLEGRRFESRIRWIFLNLSSPSSRTMALESTQPLTEMSTRKLPECKKRPARRADNLAAICEPNVCKCENLNLSQP
jgi:hypothetical protein